MFKVIINSNGGSRTVLCDKGMCLSSLLEREGIFIPMPCGGVGKCGKCRVFASGMLSDMGETEREALGADEIASGVRLACLAEICGDCEIAVSQNGAISGVSRGIIGNFAKNPISGDKDCYGAAVDIGTTTVAAYLVKLPECVICESVCVANPQSRFGADVISRIRYCTENGMEAVRDSIRECVSVLISGFNRPIESVVITGNTTMLHIYNGLDPSSLAAVPFTPKSLFGSREESVYYPQCISAYVGADITCALLASGIVPTKEGGKTSLIVDIGTNGEMAICRDGRIIAAATAAGPAFEGAGIVNGTPAVNGAINHVKYANGELTYTTVGDAAPCGICGSGLVDAVAAMLELGIIDESGYLCEPYELGSSGVKMYPADIRELQLAKSAIRSGIDTLIHESGIQISDIDNFYIAGGFGSYLDPKSCAKIGLLPERLAEIALPIGNGAGMGAVMLLCDASLEESVCRAASSAELCELSTSPYFMEKYIDNMMF